MLGVEYTQNAHCRALIPFPCQIFVFTTWVIVFPNVGGAPREDGARSGRALSARAFRKLIQLDANENVRRRGWPRCGCRPAILHARTCVRYATGMQTLRNNYYNAVDRDCARRRGCARARARECECECTVIARALMACMHLALRRYTVHGNSG